MKKGLWNVFTTSETYPWSSVITYVAFSSRGENVSYYQIIPILSKNLNTDCIAILLNKMK